MEHPGEQAEPFWSANQPGFRFSASPVGSPEFFAEVEEYRYSLEPHIPEVVQFEQWKDRRVLEAGCGMATDGARFARAGAHYTGLDFSAGALSLARRKFSLEDLPGRFVRGSVSVLPFADGSFDLVYSHGVIHHIADTERAVEEFHRVLSPTGTAIVMLYHRRSLNYYLTILTVRRALVGLLAVPGAVPVVAKVTGESDEVLDGHRRLLQREGLRYVLDKRLFLSNNTDGPGNPLSKVYSRPEAESLFHQFADVDVDIRHLNLRTYPAGDRLAKTRLAGIAGRRAGWHLYVRAQKTAT